MQFGLDQPKAGTGRVLLFSPHALVTQHGELETALATLFLSAGDEVEVLRCGGELIGGCALQVAEPVDSRGSICERCKASASAADAGQGYAVSNLSQVKLQPTEEQEIWRLSALSSQELRHYKFQGTELGAYWSYDLTLSLKSADRILHPDHHEELLRCAQAGLRAFFVGLKKIREFRPTAVVVYSQQYGVNRCFAAAARKEGVAVLNVHHRGPLPNRFRSFSVSLSDTADKPIWRPNFSELLSLPLLATEVAILSAHFTAVYQSRSHTIYSKARGTLSAQDVRKKMGLRAGQIVVVATSSPDEPLAAAEANLLPRTASVVDDFSALEDMMELVDAFPAVDFVFRVHPRLFPNAREKRTSPYGPEMINRLRQKQKKSSNLCISLPQDSIGLYDLALVADCVITQRSSAAHEFAVLGIPAIYTDPSMNPIDKTVFPDYHWPGDGSLRERLRKALISGPDYVQAVAHLRFAATALIRSVVPIHRSPNRLDSALALGARTEIINRILSRFAKSRGAKPTVPLEIDGRRVIGEGLSVSAALKTWPQAQTYKSPGDVSTPELALLNSFLRSVLPVFGKIGSGSGVAFRSQFPEFH